MMHGAYNVKLVKVWLKVKERYIETKYRPVVVLLKYLLYDLFKS